ncbi:DUF3040 domain-containing protein [Streptomyces sp. NPDC048350]|uniref:DUF3040 domain-containing protein n=1 Tax=Streptomyces sp. NPDC048350 TaxID=3365538 RepID=UPI0037171453
MSHPADDQRILAEIEQDLSRDDPALVALVDALNQQFPKQQPTPPGEVRASRRHRARVVTAVVLAVIAVLGLILIAVLSAPATPPDVNNGIPSTW